MKWFIKCLRHYADFSGRARRREYWMFTLFNAIFMLVLMFVLALMAARSWDDETMLQIALQLIWFSLLGLPGMAVSVRRLHDLGKSGWMVLVALIPIVGTIWMLVLMATEGQTGENRFGPDPKTSPETFPDRAKLTSAGVVVIIGASLGLLSGLCAWLLPEYYYGMPNSIPLFFVLRAMLIPVAMHLVAGILLVRSGERERTRPALWILLVVCGWSGIGNLINLPRMLEALNVNALNTAGFLSNVAHVLLSLSVALIAAQLLFAPRNRDAIRGSAVAVMAAGGFCLAMWLLQIGDQSGVETLGIIFNLLSALGTIGYMVLAWAFFSRKEGAAQQAAPATAMPKEPAQQAVPKEPVKQVAQCEHILESGKCMLCGKTIEEIVRTDLTFAQWAMSGNYQNKYYSQKADSLAHACEILKKLPSIPPMTYYLVDTPDGTLGRDIIGFFTESPIKTRGLQTRYRRYGKSGESTEAQSLMIFGDMMKVHSTVATQKACGQYAELILMMKCGQCGYESPVETKEGDMERECYFCGTNNKTHRGGVNVFTMKGFVKI